jgi:general stress protein YciG
MAGTKTGGRQAAQTNKKKHGADFYARIGAMGGKKGRTGGFFANRELAREAGRKGGRISRRTKAVKIDAQKDFELAA